MYLLSNINQGDHTMEKQAPKTSMIKGLVAVVCLGLVSSAANATIVKDQKQLGWASYRDLTSSKFSERFKEYKNKGYMMIDIDAYPTSSGLRYSMVWRENTDKRGWAEHRNLTSAQYSAKWNEYKAKGYRPLDIAAYPSGTATRYAGIWVQNKEGLAWSSHRNLTSSAYGELYSQKRRDGYRLVDMEAYTTSSGLRYSAIWYKNTEGKAWTQYRNMTRASYQDKVNSLGRSGYMVVDFESYKVGTATRYAAIWEKKPGYAYQVRTNRTETAFANLWREYRDKGYRLVDFERYKTASGDRYGGVWVENNSRYRYANKTNIDTKVKDYLEDNDLPGISVSVIKNGKSIYRRGFGKADVANNRVAHSRTVYNAASVSKVIGGTLAAKLEEQQKLESGATFYLDLSESTDNYISGLPAHHTHTVDELLSHTGCVGHYTTTPAISNQTNHYWSATSATNNIENTGLINGCAPGNNYRYSTAGFTFVAAALEGATNRSINSLLVNELFKPHGLSDTRVQFASTNLPANYERAVPYNNNNTPSSYSNNSWKVLGGGIETSAYDLARLGDKLLKGQIVSEDTRDNRLWKRVNNNSSAGLAWFTGSKGGKRVADHSGSWTGARSYLRVYRDDNVVISIMSNRRGHSVRDVGSLADEIAAIVL